MSAVACDSVSEFIGGPDSPSIVVLENEPLVVVSVGEQGPAGVPGAPGPSGASVLELVAGEALSGHRVVTTNAGGAVVYASNTVLADALTVLGLTIGAASNGAAVFVQVGGEIVEPSWTWAPHAPVYLAANGLLTQTPPVSPAVFSLVIGFAATATKLVVDVKTPLALL